uniref:guanine nucleotide-binding protein G(T) subunit gamma-T1 isoform X2 n=1 Tax=Ictidomys tridecemlineatus TaxID=43179 RepID=UPI001A9D56BC|nr:guanine nucleotide-binding protein G(T) subunit gamma-T1 isoform X2 [Ictidomys tridecemlineatus]
MKEKVKRQSLLLNGQKMPVINIEDLSEKDKLKMEVDQLKKELTLERVLSLFGMRKKIYLIFTCAPVVFDPWILSPLRLKAGSAGNPPWNVASVCKYSGGQVGGSSFFFYVKRTYASAEKRKNHL